MQWQWFAIVLGALIILMRAPMVVRPAETMTFYRSLWATDARARFLSTIYLGFGICAAIVAVQFEGDAQILFLIFAMVMFGVAAWLLLAPAGFRDLADAIFGFVIESVDAAIIRLLAGLGIGVGAWLIYFGIHSL